MNNIDDIVKVYIERKLGIDKYNLILDKLYKCDVSKDNDFQKLYNVYYRIRRNKSWRNKYYSYFEKNKNNKKITYDEIIDYLYNNCSSNNNSKYPVEASFASKMYAAINPDKPILDSQVLDKMNIKISGKSKSDKLQSAKLVYKNICDKYLSYLKTDNCKKAIELFDSIFSSCKRWTNTKKVDWFMWAMSKNELNDLGLFGDLLK